MNTGFAAINGSALGGSLQDLLMAEDIQPGSTPSYQLCKTIYSYHPLGKKMADTPLEIAQSQEREISIPKGPEERLKEAHAREWEEIGADRHLFNFGRLARVYGVSALACLVEGVPPDRPLNFKALADADIAFNVFDPLNTAGSLVLDQNPNHLTFQKTVGIAVAGQPYHRSRCVVLQNEDPIYIEYTSSGFGYVGRSVYQRALFPLKSFIQSMVCDDMVLRKSGLLIAKLEPGGSIIDNIMQVAMGVKRAILQAGQNNNVISVGTKEEIASLDLANIDGAFIAARKDALENAAAACDMPAKLLNNESYAEGFGEGSEDAKYIAKYIKGVRKWINPGYNFLDRICMHRAWNEDFYKTIQADFPKEYGNKPYNVAFWAWRNSFQATWPNLLEEPDSEKVGVDDVKLKAMIAIVEVVMPNLPQEQKAKALLWFADNLNAMKFLFTSPLLLNWQAVAEFEPPMAAGAAGDETQKPAPPFSARDSANVKRLVDTLERDPLSRQERMALAGRRLASVR